MCVALIQVHGHPHILSRLASSHTRATKHNTLHSTRPTLQRSEHRRGQLPPERHRCLAEAGFEFDADQAEWMRWYKELASYSNSQGGGSAADSSPAPLTHGVDLYLINWCSVQRIARRSRVLSEQRVQMLDHLGFDWSGADPLS